MPLALLKDLRKTEAKKLDVKPWIIFFDPSLQDMATYYPTSKDDIVKISGVSNAHVELVWDPPWSEGNMSDEAKLTLGLF